MLTFALPKGLLKLCLLLSIVLAVPGCAGGKHLGAIRSACASLLPDELRSKLTGAPPRDRSSLADWFNLVELGDLVIGKAKHRTLTADDIIAHCEKRSSAARQAEDAALAAKITTP